MEEWLLYCQHSSEKSYASPAFLWAVKADGSESIQLDTKPVVGLPRWSPIETSVVYLAQNSQQSLQLTLSLTKIEQGKATTTHPLGDKELREVSWMPDGRSLLVSTSANKDEPIRMMKVDLSGKLQDMFQIGENQKANEEMYFEQFQADGFAVSPNGRYAAFFVRPNSASISTG
ncbi:hypothetical protein ACI7RC_00630 [Brevibacillus sp. B_LB10_24]|uniref:hypothetical protein n=1 Tax=Brevibacillus sp. B_LB10_24 TaxID=3380645 RepID=UPI0038B768AE